MSTSNPEQQGKLKELLSKAESLFDGTLGEWDCEPHHIQSKDGVKPHHAEPFPVPKAHERTLWNEIEGPVNVGVLEQVNHSEWGAPSFITGKKDGTARFINNLWESNKHIKQCLHTTPRISDLLQKLKGFQWATVLDLNVGCHHV